MVEKMIIFWGLQSAKPKDDLTHDQMNLVFA